jgi:hypothetical protein
MVGYRFSLLHLKGGVGRRDATDEYSTCLHFLNCIVLSAAVRHLVKPLRSVIHACASGISFIGLDPNIHFRIGLHWAHAWLMLHISSNLSTVQR